MPHESIVRLATVRGLIDAAAQAASRRVSEVNLVAVSKVFPAEAILPVLQAGQRIFGENRVQEAAGKWPQLREIYPEVELHMIGPLQSNKAEDAVRLFDVIETVDRPKIARALAKAFEKTGLSPGLFVQVNTGEEPQKAGILPENTDAFINSCRNEYGLEIEGLMCIPPANEEPSLHFALLEKMARRNGISGLSMGMSADYETAIAFGATSVRVGSAIFGPRPRR